MSGYVSMCVSGCVSVFVAASATVCPSVSMSVCLRLGMCRCVCVCRTVLSADLARNRSRAPGVASEFNDGAMYHNWGLNYNHIVP